MSKKINKEQSRGVEKTLVLDIRFSRGVVLALIGIVVIAGIIGYFAIEQQQVLASNPQSVTAGSSQPMYYLTSSTYNGDAVTPVNIPNETDVCDSGYHFASMWEIVDPSNLEYNTSKGLTRADGGSGPPSAIKGWVRTGYISASSIAGQANCTIWTSSSDQVSGTWVALSNTWAANDQELFVWDIDIDTCDTDNYVWCVED
jgi:hypothetical protein